MMMVLLVLNRYQASLHWKPVINSSCFFVEFNADEIGIIHWTSGTTVSENQIGLGYRYKVSELTQVRTQNSVYFALFDSHMLFSK